MEDHFFMKNKKLYMIGNSHIDPVWFWTYEEGMQEVNATYASALARMKEFDEFRFTCTSTAFLEWVEQVQPEMFREICERVQEGRWEITGGWFLEPDCILPCGEAFVRQGLYAQRYLKKQFGKICRIGSNVDSFGHNPMLPQILKKSGMDQYVFMRPRLETPLFFWESDDGSRVTALCLPGEYTTWFHDPTVQNIETTLEKTGEYDKMVCCYGVGNHGGGPTIENIRSIQELKDSFEGVELEFSSYEDFFHDVDTSSLTVKKGPFEKINVGCYSIDSPFKMLNRLAERRMVEADVLMSMAKLADGEWMPHTKEMEQLWKGILFNQFHDTMGGTTIKSAREEAMMQLSGVCARAGLIKTLAIQKIAAQLDTRGEGFPLILFNTGSTEYEGLVEAELEWFCQAPLRILDPDGQEIEYQRIHTDAKVRHTTLGGRRRILFEAKIPACGFAVYRTVKEPSALCRNNEMQIEDPTAACLENPYLKAVFDPATGQLTALVDKETGYDAVKGTSSVRVYQDERDAWGGLQGRVYEDREIAFSLISIEKIESGALREAIRVRTECEGTFLEQIYYLGAKDRELQVENHLIFNQKWTLLKAAYPVGEACTYSLSETAYGTQKRNHQGDEEEYSMQRFVDVTDAQGKGLAVANDGKYAFNLKDGRLQITLCRSAIYAQGNSKNWYNEIETYQYTDLGPQTFWFSLHPHGEKLSAGTLYQMAKRRNGAYEYLAGHVHPGKIRATKDSLASVDCPGTELLLIKKCEDDDSLIVRLVETEGTEQTGCLTVNQKTYPFTIGKHEIKTLKICEQTEKAEEVNLLEWREF